MMKKMMAGAAVAVSLVGISAAVAPSAMAIGNEGGTTSVNGNGAVDSFGNSVTRGDGSPQVQLVQGSLNKLCVGAPIKANAGALVGILVPVAVQDINVLSSPQNQQCADNSTQAKGDEALSHLVNGIPVLSGNGIGNN
ncbi:rodlin [Streptomyces sp. NBC_01013]|nr:rodlin [Streptomyces sp. NBC_01013]